jgi:hypothetical protein
MWDVPRTYTIYKYVNRSPVDQDSSKTGVVGGYCLLTSQESSSSKTLVLWLLFSRAWSSSTRALAVQAMAQVYQFEFKQAWSPGQVNQVWEGFLLLQRQEKQKKKVEFVYCNCYTFSKVLFLLNFWFPQLAMHESSIFLMIFTVSRAILKTSDLVTIMFDTRLD